METTNGRIAVRKNQAAGSTLPEIGKIKVGMKVTNSKGTEYPTSLDYFRATGNFAQAFQSLFGDKPKSLSVAFISDDLSESCNERYECWTNGKRHGYGDGQVFSVWDAAKKEYTHNVPSNDPRVTALKWDVMLTLRFILVDMKGILGYWTFSTKGKASTIPSVVKAFDFVRERAQTIIGFPFTLMVDKKTGYNPGDAKSYPVVTLVPNFTQEAMEKVANYLEQGGNLNKINTKFIQAAESITVPESRQLDIPKVTVETTGELFSDNEGAMS